MSGQLEEDKKRIMRFMYYRNPLIKMLIEELDERGDVKIRVACGDPSISDQLRNIFKQYLGENDTSTGRFTVEAFDPLFGRVLQDVLVRFLRECECDTKTFLKRELTTGILGFRPLRWLQRQGYIKISQETEEGSLIIKIQKGDEWREIKDYIDDLKQKMRITGIG